MFNHIFCHCFYLKSHSRSISVLFYLFFSCVVGHPVMAQTPCTCAYEKERIPEIVRHFNSGNVDSALVIFEQIRRTGLPECRMAYCNGMAQYYFNKNEFKQVRPYMDEERRLLDSLGCSPIARARHFNTFGHYYLSINNYQKAVECYLEALSNSNAAKDPMSSYRSLINLSVVSSNNKETEKSLDYLRQAETAVWTLINSKGDNPQRPKMDHTDQLSEIYTRKADGYNELYALKKEPALADSAQNLARKALAIAQRLRNGHVISHSYAALAEHAALTGQYAAALALADSVWASAPQSLGNMYKYQAFLLKSKALMDQGTYAQSAVFADSALWYAERFNPQMVQNALLQVYETQKKIQQFGRALAAFERHTLIKDSLAGVEKINTINELEQQYNKVKNEKSIRELMQEREIITLRNRLLLLGVLLAAGIILVLVFLQRQRAIKARQNQLETEQRLNRARMNPHFFFNALGALQALVLKNGDARHTAVHLSKFAAIMRQTLDSTYTEYVSIEEEKNYLNQYLELQQLRFPDSFSFEIEVDEALDEQETLVPPMLIQPFAENAIEHGFSDKNPDNHLAIHFAKAENMLLLTIKDNGKGLSSTQTRSEKHISRATQIIRDRLDILNQQQQTQARFTIENRPGDGVLAKVYVPLTHKS